MFSPTSMEPQRTNTESDLTSLDSSLSDRDQVSMDVDDQSDQDVDSEPDIQSTVPYNRVFSEARLAVFRRMALHATENLKSLEYSWTTVWSDIMRRGFPDVVHFEVLHEGPTVEGRDKVDLQVVLHLENKKKLAVMHAELKDFKNFKKASERQAANAQIVDRLKKMHESKDPLLPKNIPIISAFGPRFKILHINEDGFFCPAITSPDDVYLNPDIAPEEEWNHSINDLQPLTLLISHLRDHFERVYPLEQRKAVYKKLSQTSIPQEPTDILPEYGPPNYIIPQQGANFHPIIYLNNGGASTATYSSVDSEDDFVPARKEVSIGPSGRVLRSGPK